MFGRSGRSDYRGTLAKVVCACRGVEMNCDVCMLPLYINLSSAASDQLVGFAVVVSRAVDVICRAA